ncbi:hypothetical protein FACS1894111_10160 [Clostridia bacterium]|nr:hypothetical protein FACS1894111_10160 [Clostridia bacterium]
MKKKRSYHYKFTEKKHSVKGFAAIGLSGLSIAAFVFSVSFSFWRKGEGGVYLGSMGILALALAICALVLGIRGAKEESSFRTFPIVGTILGVIAAAGWLLVYGVGVLV